MKKLGFANEIIIQKDKKDIPENSFSIIQKDLEIYIPFEDLVDIEAEKERLEKEKREIRKRSIKRRKNAFKSWIYK